MNTEQSILYIEHRLVDTFERGDVINLLKERDKYKKIVEEVERFLEPGAITEIPEDMVGSRHIDIITYQIKKIKQKYFPEKFKREFVIELETDDIHAIQNAVDRIRVMFDGGKFMNCTPKITVDRG